MIRDKKESRSYVVHVDALAKKPNQLRMDFSTPVGIELGYFVLNNNKVTYYLAQKKKKRTVKANARSLRPLIKTDLDPHLLVNMLFDEEPQGKSWKCERDKKGFLKKCNNTNKKISLEWLKRQNTQRAIQIETRSARIQLSLKGFRPKVEMPEKNFQL